MPPQTPKSQTPQEYLREQARLAGVPEALALGIADQESSFNPMAVGKEFDLGPGKKTRAYGMFQILPETALQYGADPAHPLASVQDPVQNVQIGLRYLKFLHDKFGGNLDQVLATYGGVKTDPTYVPTATAKILQWQKTIEHETASGGPGGDGGELLSKATGIRPTTFWDRHPYLNAAVESFDPHEREARQNIAGAIGGIGGALIGGPIGSVLGAGAAGAAENAFVEEPGYGDWIAKTGLPIAEAVLNVRPGHINGPPPPPDSTPLSRTLEAGAWQAGGDLVGQGLGGIAKAGIKRFVQGPIAKAAFDHFAKVKSDAIEVLRNAVESLTERLNQEGVAGSQAGREAQAAAQAATDAAKATGQQAVKDVARAGTAESWAARAAKHRTVAQARDAVARQLRDARARAAALVKGHRAQGAAGIAQVEADAAAGMPPRPPFIDAGQAVHDVVEGPARDAYRALGRAVDEAAEAATGDVDITALKAEVERIARTELLPPEVSFPRTDPAAAHPPTPPAPPPPSSIIDPSTGKPFASPVPAAAAAATDTAATAGDDVLAQLAAELSDREKEALKNNPAMHVIGRILRAPARVPFKDAHLWKSQLQAAIRGTYDAVQRSQAENITMHAAAELRKALSGNPAYDAATAAYEAASPAFTEHVAQTIRSVARDSPEAIVDLLTPDRPSHARTLVSLLTDYAARGGGEDGAKAGQAALKGVREAWLHKHVFEGPVSGLGDRLAQLRARPEFADAVFGQDYKEVFDNLDAIVKAYHDKVVEAAALDIAAKMQGKHGVETAKDTGRAEIEAARSRADAAFQATRTRTAAAKDQAAAAASARTGQVASEGKTVVEAAKRAKEAQRLTTTKELRDSRRAVQTRAAGLSGSPEEAAEKAFAESTLKGKSGKAPEQAAADIMHAVLLGPSNVWGGLSWARMFAGASDADLLKYAVHSTARTQAWVQAIRAAKFAGPVIGAATKPARTLHTAQDAARATRNAADDAARKAKAGQKPGELYLTIGGR